MFHISVFHDQLSGQRIGSMYEYNGIEHTIVEAFKEMDGDTQEPTGYLILGLEPIGSPEAAGPVDEY